MNPLLELQDLDHAMEEPAIWASLLPYDVEGFRNQTNKDFVEDVLPVYRKMFALRGPDEQLNTHLTELLDRHKKYLFTILRTPFPRSIEVLALAARLWALSLAMDDLLDGHGSRLGVDSYWRSVGVGVARADIMNEVRRVYATVRHIPEISNCPPEPYIDLAFQALDRQKHCTRALTLREMISLYVERQAFISIWPYVAQRAPQGIQLASALLSVAGQIHNDLKDYSKANLDGSHGLMNFPIWFERSWPRRESAVVSASLIGLMLLNRALEWECCSPATTGIARAIEWRAARLREWLPH